MKNLAIYLTAGASALLVTAASATAFPECICRCGKQHSKRPDCSGMKAGQCWRERGERRVIVREHHDSYGYAPRRERHIQRRG